MINGIDTSVYQGEINFDSAKSQVDFILVKATEGVGYQDKEFTRSQSEARRVGMLLGYYHFARPDLGNSPEQEADYLVSVIGTPNSGEILALDFEVTYSDPVTWCKAFLDHVSSKLNGYKPLIYLNDSLIKNHDWSPVINAGYGLWIAEYDNTPASVSFDTPWPVVAMKQYSSAGQVSGISGNVDLDVLYGDESTFKAYGYHTVTSVPTTIGNPPIAPDVPLVLSDAQPIQLGAALGILTLGSIRSKLLDNARDLASAKTTIEDQQVEITKLQEQVNALQEINKQTVSDVSNAVNSAPQTGNSPTYQVAPAQPEIGLNIASLFSDIYHWIFR